MAPFPRGPEVQAVLCHQLIWKVHRYVSYTDNYARLPLLAIVYPTVPNYHKDMAALQCLAQVLGQGKNSILYQQLVKKQWLFKRMPAFSQLSEFAGEFFFQVIPAWKSFQNGYIIQVLHWILLKHAA